MLEKGVGLAFVKMGDIDTSQPIVFEVSWEVANKGKARLSVSFPLHAVVALVAHALSFQLISLSL